MNIIKTAFEVSEEGDRIMITFPDIYSFYYVSKWLSENVGEIFWILWTDAAVERINYLGKKYGFPIDGEALVIGSNKECTYLRCIERADIYSDLQRLMKSLPLERRVIVVFGIDFLEVYGYHISKVVELLVEHEKGVLVTSLLKKPPEELLPFHDMIIEIVKSEDSYIAYHSYIAKLVFSMKGGVTEASDIFYIGETTN